MKRQFHSRIMALLLIAMAVLWISCDDDNDNGVTDPENTPPEITSMTAEPDTFMAYSTITITANAHDDDGDTLTYSWHASESWVIATADFANIVMMMNCCVVPEMDSSWVIATVSDGNGGEDIDSIQIWVIPLR